MKTQIYKIAIAIFVSAFLCVYGWRLFKKMEYDRLVYEVDIFSCLPLEVDRIVGFSKKHQLEEYYQIDTIHQEVLDELKPYVTYPLFLVKYKDGDNLLLAKATSDQQETIKSIFEETIAPYHQPRKEIIDDVDIWSYSFSNEEFAFVAFYKGVFMTSRSYKKIKKIVRESLFRKDIEEKESIEKKQYLRRIIKANSIGYFVADNEVDLVMSATIKKDSLIFKGAYFEVQKSDSMYWNYDYIENLLNIDSFCIDSIAPLEGNKIEMRLNKVY